MRPWSLRQAAERAGVTRATARAVAADGFVPVGNLSDADLVVLRACALTRTLTFAGEVAPANVSRQPREREADAAAAVRRITEERNFEGRVMVYAQRAVRVDNLSELLKLTMDAHASGETYVVLSAGSWVREMLGEGVGAPAKAG